MAETRRCVGSTRFGIEPHDAPIGDFSAQPSQKTGLSRMCSNHWKLYVADLGREAKGAQGVRRPERTGSRRGWTDEAGPKESPVAQESASE